MFEILMDKTICLTRGDIASIEVAASQEDGSPFVFRKGDVVRLTVYKENGCGCVVLKKDVKVETATEVVTIQLNKRDTCFCDIINEPVDYWYDIKLNPETEPQTIIGYDGEGAKVFRLFPEGR